MQHAYCVTSIPVTCGTWIYSVELNPKWQNSNLWAKSWTILLNTRNITLSNYRFDSWIRPVHTGVPFGCMYEASGHLLRVDTPPPPPLQRCYINRERGFSKIYWRPGKNKFENFNLLLVNPFRRGDSNPLYFGISISSPQCTSGWHEKSSWRKVMFCVWNYIIL